jgi:CheY-like chemotaxis protein
VPKRILVVDDSPTIRSVIKLHLGGGPGGEAGFEIIEAPEADRAQRLLRLMPVDLVIVDINMPGTDGIAFTRRLRLDPQPSIRGLPVILMTGDDSPEARQKALDAGASEFVQKPVSGASLLEAVGKLLAVRPPAEGLIK